MNDNILAFLYVILIICIPCVLAFVMYFTYIICIKPFNKEEEQEDYFDSESEQKLERLEKWLHSKQLHPDYEYVIKQGPRKGDTPNPPEGSGWEKNIDMGRDGWERFDYYEEYYWRRLKS